MTWDSHSLRKLALNAISSAWPGLDDDLREDVIDLLSTYDHVIALEQLAKSPSLAPDVAAEVHDALDWAANQPPFSVS